MTHIRKGHAVRKYFLYCEKCWGQTIENEASKKRVLPNEVEGSRKRVKAGDTVNGLMQAVSTSNPNLHRGAYAAINGMTNHAVTGKTKSQWAVDFGVQASKLNLRDHMTEEGLALATALQITSRAAIEKNPGKDPLEVHKSICQSLGVSFEHVHDKTVQREPFQKLPIARRTLAIADAPPPPQEPARVKNVQPPSSSRTITNFFTRVGHP